MKNGKGKPTPKRRNPVRRPNQFQQVMCDADRRIKNLNTKHNKTVRKRSTKVGRFIQNVKDKIKNFFGFSKKKEQPKFDGKVKVKVDNKFKYKRKKINKRRAKNKMARKSRQAQNRKKKGK